MLPRRTVLVVEDDGPMLDLLVWVLRRDGYEVEEAQHGEEATAAVERPRTPADRLCLVLLDMRLPLVDGQGVLYHLAQRGDSVPVVVVSAYPDAIRAARAAGVQATISKPFELAHLLAVVKQHCLVQQLGTGRRRWAMRRSCL